MLFLRAIFSAIVAKLNRYYRNHFIRYNL